MIGVTWSKKLYLLLLLIAGISVPILVASYRPHHFEFNLLAIMVCSIVIGLFPIFLPGDVVWGASVVFYLLSLYEYGFFTACGTLMIGTLATFIRLNDWSIFRIRWFRFFVTLGMYFCALSVANVIRQLFFDWPTYYAVAASMVLFELVNVFLFSLVMKSIGQAGPPVLQRLKSYFPMAMMTTLFLSLIIDNNTVPKLALSMLLVISLVMLSRQYLSFHKNNKDLEEKYELIANHTSDLILILDDKLHIVYASPSFLNTFGSAVVVGETVEQYLNQDSGTKLRNTIEQAQQTKTSTRIELTYQMAERVLYAESVLSPIYNDSGTLQHFLVASRDISDRVAQQEYLIRTEKLAVVGELAAGIAHEIRNPLAAIRGFMQLLKEEFDSVSNQAFSVVWSEVNRIDDITSELLMLAKPQRLNSQIVDFSEVVTNCISLMSAEANQKSLIFNTDITLSLSIDGRPNELRALVVNLLKNSIESMSASGKTITVQVVQRDAHIVLSVEDEGEGMSEDVISRMGEPFYTTKDTGTGLGFIVVQRVLQEHHGTIQIRSEMGVGTRIEVELPAHMPGVEFENGLIKK